MEHNAARPDAATPRSRRISKQLTTKQLTTKKLTTKKLTAKQLTAKQLTTKQLTTKQLKRAADAFTGFVVEALREEFLLWDKSVNFGMAEMVWNAHSMGAIAELGWHSEPKIAEMHEVLTRLRATRWRKEEFLAFGLKARTEDGEVFFRFDLTFDEGITFHPCEIVWDPSGCDLIPLN